MLKIYTSNVKEKSFDGSKWTGEAANGQSHFDRGRGTDYLQERSDGGSVRQSQDGRGDESRETVTAEPSGGSVTHPDTIGKEQDSNISSTNVSPTPAAKVSGHQQLIERKLEERKRRLEYLLERRNKIFQRRGLSLDRSN